MRPVSSSAFEQFDSEGCVVIDGILGRDKALQARAGAEEMMDRLRPGCVGKGLGKGVDSTVRGDLIAFLDDEGDSTVPESIATATRALRSARAQFAPGGEFATEALTTRVSTQLALYDGNGAHYSEHRDSWPSLEERREITAIYYMNETFEGGSLCVAGQNIEPRLDRLVIFRAKLLHRVTPSFSRRFALTQWWYSMPRIFVSIAAYRDPDVVATIQSAVNNAARQVAVGVVLQYDTLTGSDDSWLRALPRARVRRVDYRDAAGPCVARAAALDLYAEEDFVLQVDSHTRFRRNWDVDLVEEWTRCRNANAILTAYPMDFEDAQDERPTLLAPDSFDQDGMLRSVGRKLLRVQNGPIPSPLWCAGFSFCTGEAYRRVPYDPSLRFLFFGEELSMAARFWTHGYDFYAPSKAIIYHKWSREGRPNFLTDSVVPPEEIAAARSKSQAKVKALLARSTSDTEDNRFGLGRARSLKDFQRNLKVDLQTRVIQADAKNAGQPPDVFVEVSEGAAKDILDKVCVKMREMSK